MEEVFRTNYAGRLCTEHHDVLAWLPSLTEPQFSAISHALVDYAENSREFSRPDLVERIANIGQKLDAFTPAQAQELVDALISLAVMGRISRAEAKNVVEAVVQEMARVLAVDATILRPRLEELLRSSPIAGLAVREDLLYENERVYIDGRIMTDVRPVFEDDPTRSQLKVSGVMVLHSLRIRYWQEGEERSFSVALRERDLADFALLISRAGKKADSLSQGSLKLAQGPDN